tara:strand:+ start:72 stop:362 length:291 start_codon:yes stop_codon:yes gene_type:complete
VIFNPATAPDIAHRPATVGNIVGQCFVAGGIAGARYNGPKHDFATEIHGKHNETLPQTPWILLYDLLRKSDIFLKMMIFQILQLFYIRPSGLPHRF